MVSAPTRSISRSSTSCCVLSALTRPAVLGHLGGIAAGRGHRAHVAVRVLRDRLGLQVARARHRRAVAAPQRLQIGVALLTILGRHVAPREGLGGALELAGPKQMHVDAELVERILEEHAIAVVAVEQHEAERIQVHLIGLGREVILVLQKIGSVRDDLLAAVAERGDGSGEFLELGLAGAAHVIGIDDQHHDARIAGRGANRGGQVPQQRLRRALALRLVERTLDRLATELLDDIARRPHDQRGLIRQPRARLPQRADHDAEQRQQQQQMQAAAQHVEAAPYAVEEPAEVVHTERSSIWRAARALGDRSSYVGPRSEVMHYL